MDQPAAPRAQSTPSVLDRVFDLGNSGSNVRTELLAGLTTFLTMVYIVFVNPQILGNAGMDKGAVFVATCIAAAVSTAVMALYANYPIALAPGMGLNAFFAFTVVLTMKYTWQQALAAVFCSGRDLLPDLDLPHPRIHHQFDTAESQARHIGGRRPVSRHHRARGSKNRGGVAGDAGHPRRPAQSGAAPLPARPGADHRAQLPARTRRHADRHPDRHRDRHSARSRALQRRRRHAAVAPADAVAARLLPHRRRLLPHRHFQLPVRRRVRQCRHADRRHPSRRADSTRTATCRA